MNELREKFNGRLNPAAAGVAMSFTTVVYVLVSLIAAMIIKAAGVENGSDGYVYISYLSAALGIILGIAATLLFARQKVSVVLPLKCSWKYYLIALLMIFGLTFSVSRINDLFVSFLELFGYVPRPQEDYVPALGGGLIVPAILVIALLPAISEETLFRGIILQNVKSGGGDIAAVLLVGLSFALFHASAEQTIYQFICGCSFALLAVRSGSVLPCMMIHFLNNAAIIVMYACGVETFGSAAEIALTVVGAVSFAVSILLLIIEKKHFKKGEKGSAIEFFKYASVGLALMAILWISSLFAR